MSQQQIRSSSAPSSPQPKERVVSWKMTQCLNPDCLHSNPNTVERCQRCQSKLLLSDRYRAVRTIGSGGFACAFAAVDEHRLRTPCVIKQFLPRQQNHEILQTSMNLFKQEAHILRDLGNHPQIPALLAFFEQEQRFYLVQEFIDGLSLFEVLATQGAFSEQQVRSVFGQLLPLLQFVHERQVIHRDIKLSNIIRQPDSSLVLIDFGGSMAASADFRSITGTPGYAAPEQLQGRVCPASDLYSLGVIGLRLLMASLPQDDGSDPLFDPQRQQWCPLPTHISPEFQQILSKLLQQNVEERYSSAAHVLEDLAPETPAPKSTPSGPVTTQRDRVLLRSAAGLDYRPLRNLLAAENYREADQETWHLLLQAADRQAEGSLSLGSLRKIPQPDLETLDQLWQTFSHGQFGFTVQKQIYQGLGGKTAFDYPLWTAFGQQVGWCVDRQWINYSHLGFSTQAPRGSFPACFADPLNRTGFARGACGWWRVGFVTLIERLGHPGHQAETWL
ncbi:serine/threonine-protein kinase [Acaryochloris thomasi]|uniref:serine/threonine-protein kinase n=1 Tax=Acaryochloris thomasi TaxID=2929456 RepID=UPI001F1DF5DA|nr:serine/threonine-protein kinase [Acaryochloris thomasi]